MGGHLIPDLVSEFRKRLVLLDCPSIFQIHHVTLFQSASYPQVLSSQPKSPWRMRHEYHALQAKSTRKYACANNNEGTTDQCNGTMTELEKEEEEERQDSYYEKDGRWS